MDQTHPPEADLDFFPFGSPPPPPSPHYPNRAGMGAYSLDDEDRVAGWRPLTETELGVLWATHMTRHSPGTACPCPCSAGVEGAT